MGEKVGGREARRRESNGGYRGKTGPLKILETFFGPNQQGINAFRIIIS